MSDPVNIVAMSDLAKYLVDLDDPNGVYVKLSRGEGIGAELVIGELPTEWNKGRCMYVIFPPGETPEHMTILAEFETAALAQSTAHTLALFKNMAYEEGYARGQAASLDGRLTELNNTLTQAALLLSGAEAVIKAEEKKRAKRARRGQ